MKSLTFDEADSIVSSAIVSDVKTPVRDDSAQEGFSNAVNAPGATLFTSILDRMSGRRAIGERLAAMSSHQEVGPDCRLPTDIAPRVRHDDSLKDANLKPVSPQTAKSLVPECKQDVQSAFDDGTCKASEKNAPEEAAMPRNVNAADQLLRQKFVEVSTAQQQVQHENMKLQEENAELRELASLLASVAVVRFLNLVRCDWKCFGDGNQSQIGCLWKAHRCLGAKLAEVKTRLLDSMLAHLSRPECTS
jgi:hypothetical protein